MRLLLLVSIAMISHRLVRTISNFLLLREDKRAYSALTKQT